MLTLALFMCAQVQVASGDGYAADLFTWIGSLGYQDDLRKPFVRVDEVGDPKMNRDYPVGYGFLVADNPKTFDVLIPSLSIRTYYKSNGPWDASWPIQTACAYKPADFRAFADGYLSSIGQRNPAYGFVLGSESMGWTRFRVYAGVDVSRSRDDCRI